MTNSYHLMRRIYPKLGVPLRGRATLNFNLHAGRANFDPVLVSGTWTAEIDATKPFEEAFADLALLMMRGAGLNWQSVEIQERLRSYREQNLPSPE
jgi:hypothetical protein